MNALRKEIRNAKYNDFHIVGLGDGLKNFQISLIVDFIIYRILNFNVLCQKRIPYSWLSCVLLTNKFVNRMVISSAGSRPLDKGEGGGRSPKKIFPPFGLQ